MASLRFCTRSPKELGTTVLIRWFERQYALVQHDDWPGYANRPLPDDYSDGGDSRKFGEKEIRSAVARNISSYNASVHNLIDRRHPDSWSADIFPGAQPWTDPGALADECRKDILK